MDSTLTVICTKCHLPKTGTLEFFAPFPKKTNGLSSWCRECMRERDRIKMRMRRKLEPEKVLAEKKRHAQSEKGRETKRRHSCADNHRARAWRRGLPSNWKHQDWERCLLAWGHSCAYCRAKGVRIVHDHYIPLCHPDSPGTVAGNIVPSCDPCNQSKWKSHPSEWCSSDQRARIEAYFAKISQPDPPFNPAAWERQQSPTLGLSSGDGEGGGDVR